MRKFTIRDLALAALIAAVYAVLTVALPIPQYSGVQLRVAEAMTVLPFLFPAATPGLFVGCLIVNLLSPYGVLDIVVGSAATLIAALWTSKLKNKWLAPLPPVICNTVLVGFTIGLAEAGGFTAALPAAWAWNGFTVGVGELGACYVLGMLLLELLPKIAYFRSIIPERRLTSL